MVLWGVSKRERILEDAGIFRSAGIPDFDHRNCRFTRRRQGEAEPKRKSPPQARKKFVTYDSVKKRGDFHTLWGGGKQFFRRIPGSVFIGKWIFPDIFCRELSAIWRSLFCIWRQNMIVAVEIQFCPGLLWYWGWARSRAQTEAQTRLKTRHFRQKKTEKTCNVHCFRRGPPIEHPHITVTSEGLGHIMHPWNGYTVGESCRDTNIFWTHWKTYYESISETSLETSLIKQKYVKKSLCQVSKKITEPPK